MGDEQAQRSSTGSATYRDIAGPVEHRAFSGWLMRLRRGRKPLATFAEAVDAKKNRHAPGWRSVKLQAANRLPRRDDILRLQNMIGRDLSAWLRP